MPNVFTDIAAVEQAAEAFMAATSALRQSAQAAGRVKLAATAAALGTLTHNVPLSIGDVLADEAREGWAIEDEAAPAPPIVNTPPPAGEAAPVHTEDSAPATAVTETGAPEGEQHG
jgi:hypothetical protein